MSTSQDTTVAALVQALTRPARGAAHFSIDRDYCREHGIRSEGLALPFYVEPHLSYEAPPTSPDAPEKSQDEKFCFLISAPAAVGKSTLAQHVHYALRDCGSTVLYIPLQEAKIGQDFFAGRLSGVFPTVARHDILQAVFSGRIVLLFDGYDEVSMTAEQLLMNKLFIGEIVSEYKKYRAAGGLTSLCIAFLFRTVFFDFGVFDDIVPFAQRLRIEFFDPREQKQFLTGYLRKKSPDSKRDFDHLVDLFLQGFEQRLSAAKNKSEAFFGHAIVLSAFGDYLLEQDDGNVYAMAHRLADGLADEGVSVPILTKIVETILTREKDKFPNSQFRHLLPSFDGYTEDIQEALLRSVASDLGRDSSHLRAAIDNIAAGVRARFSQSSLDEDQWIDLLSRYREELTKKVELHPFVDVDQARNLTFRNPLYRDLYLAQFIEQNPDAEFDSMFVGKNAASYFLPVFFVSRLAGRDLGRHGRFLYYFINLLSSSASADDFEFQLAWTEGGGWSGRAESDTIKLGDFVIGDDVLVIQIPDGGTLRGLAIDGGARGVVSLARAEGPLKRGQVTTIRESSISAATVEFAVAELAYDAVIIEAEELLFGDVVNGLDGLQSLIVRPRPGYTLGASSYVKNRWGDALKAAALSQTAGIARFKYKIQSLLLWFRKHGRVDYGVYEPRYLTCALNKGRDSDAIVVSDFLFHVGALSREGRLIVMNQKVLATHGIHYKQQNTLTFGPETRALYERFLKWPSADGWEERNPDS
jgi:hypothetical protein